MSEKLKKAVLDFAEDLTTIETAVIRVNKVNNSKADILSYSKIEFEGDAINFVNNSNSEEIATFHRELLMTSVRGRRAFWNFIIKALE